MKADPPLEDVLYLAPTKRSTLARATSYLLRLGILFGFAWGLSSWFETSKVSSPDSFFSTSHSGVLKEKSCPQVDALIPEKNLFFWTLLADELGSDDFKDRAVNWLGGAVKIE